MKAKIGRGGGFRGALNYVLDSGQDRTGDKNPEVVGGTLSATDAKGMTAEFGVSRQLRPEVKRPVWHCSLALPAGERLSAEQWQTVASDFMAKMEFPPDTQYTAVRHSDTGHDHIHIVASRISLSGDLWLGAWEARRAITASQELEREHDLTLTPGLGDARAERRKLTANEINQAVRTGDEPTRQRLQRLIDVAVDDKATAPELAARLEAAGVGVRANLASTGRMNGFSFEIDGVPFKGSDLGKKYTWSGLQKRGISYEQTRDGAELQRYRTAATDRAIGQDASADSSGNERRPEPVAGSSLSRDGVSLGTAEQTPAGSEAGPGRIRQGQPEPAADAGRVEPAHDRASGGDLRESGTEARIEHQRTERRSLDTESEHQEDRAGGGANAGTAETPVQQSESHDAGRRRTDPGREQDAAAHLAASHRPGSGRSGRRGAGNDWSSRFRAASAEKRRAKERDLGGEGLESRNAERAPVPESDRVAARQVDPTAYLEASGFTVKSEGRHLSVRDRGDEVYRVTKQSDGHYLWCDRYGNSGGDNIDLVREVEPGTGFADAVYRLHGNVTLTPQPRPAEPRREPPRLPSFTDVDRGNGRGYLHERGISDRTIDHAEQAGMVRYAAGSVLFVGQDPDGTARNATRRATAPSDPVQKRDLRGSDKSYPPVLPGDPARVWIVEGGINALASQDYFIRRDQEPPTVIVSGGANVRSWLDNPDIQQTLRVADRVTIAGEIEKSVEVQERTDAGHQKQADKIQTVTNGDVYKWSPPSDKGKDIADVNRFELTQMQEKERTQKQEQSLQNNNGHGMDMGMS